MKVFVVLMAILVALVSSAVALKDEVCGLPSMEIGQCRASKPRFSYLPETNECIRFFYGGCFGNDNNFVTKSECEQKCKE